MTLLRKFELESERYTQFSTEPFVLNFAPEVGVWFLLNLAPGHSMSSPLTQFLCFFFLFALAQCQLAPASLLNLMSPLLEGLGESFSVCFGLLTEGDAEIVYGWGRGEHGRLGFGNDKSSIMVPQRVQLLVGEDIFQFGRGDHGTSGHPSEVSINLPPPKNLSGGEADGRWCAELVACGGRHTLAIVEWHPDES
ncbi:hypothetical protein RHSIM_Rhsim10G0062700 [Rhododendron simsii]|uniref:Uncharacterized protein n=1 Tax=Rhododendron simsii TaxID=118357 RepID=A0A834G9N4_RHOSS|nr:hypothetical protein RHSIM_Rhsim10G0062700 [Rhododendron simsii]